MTLASTGLMLELVANNNALSVSLIHEALSL